MDDADELLREAKRRFGAKAVDNALDVARQHLDRSGTVAHFFSASNVDFRTSAIDEVKKATEPTDHPQAIGSEVKKPATGKTIAREEAKSVVLLAAGIKYEYIYAMLGLVLGLAAILGGCTLCLHGVSGSTSWTASALGMKSQVNDAGPGVVLFIVGLFMIFVTKPKVRLSDLKG